MEYPSIREALREIDAIKREQRGKGPRQGPRQGKKHPAQRKDAATPKEPQTSGELDDEVDDDVAFPFDEIPEPNANTLTLSSRVDDLCGAAVTNGGTITIQLAATARSRRIATDDLTIIMGSSRLVDLCAKWLKDHGDNKMDRTLTATPIEGWVVDVEPSTDEAWTFTVRRLVDSAGLDMQSAQIHGSLPTLQYQLTIMPRLRVTFDQ